MNAFIDPRGLPSPIIPDLNSVGGKAANLLALRELGFSVPNFLVWPAAMCRTFLGQCGFDLQIPMDETEAESRREALLNRPFCKSCHGDLLTVFSHFKEKPICVRSSGTFEDLNDLSFAGLYDTVLKVRTVDELMAAVRTCWASLLGERVRKYFQHHELPIEKAGMAIIFQEFVQGDYSGVAFTVNPVTGRQNHILLEYCAGTGDKLVSGHVNPKSAVWDHKTDRLISGELPPGLAAASMRDFRKIHREFGQPQDIEWVLAKGRLWILQTRAITRIAVEPSFGSWTTADFRDGGVSSSVVTPMMWSLYDYIWQYNMPRYFEIIKLREPERKSGRAITWGDMFFGRPYWNLGEVVRTLLKIPGFDERNFFSDLGIQTVHDYRMRRVPFSIRGLASILPTIVALEKYYEYRLKDNREFRRKFPHLIEPFTSARFSEISKLSELPKHSGLPKISGLSELDVSTFTRLFRDLITKVYFQTESTYFQTIYNASNAKLDFKVWLDVLNARGFDISYIKLISGLLRMKHLAPMKALAELAKRFSAIPGLVKLLLETPSREVEGTLAGYPHGKIALDEMETFIAKYGYHSPRELDISVPRWEDDREPVWRLLKTYLRDPDPESAFSHEKKQHGLYREEVDRVRNHFGSFFQRLVLIEKRFFFKNLLRTRKYCWWREEIRDYSSRVYGLIRRFLVEAERRFELPKGAVFWLTWRQVLAALEGNLTKERMLRLIESAAEESAMYRFFPNPDELGTGFLSPSDKQAPIGAANRMQGLGCSPGVTEGRVRVLHALSEVDSLERGEILVTPFTEPGWTPAFHLLAGVITETGGILSHAAVISREYGIPAILNLPRATIALHTGMRVRIDGSAGTVEILDKV